MQKIPLRTNIPIFAQGLSRPSFGRTNVNTTITQSKTSGYILHSVSAALFFLCAIVAFSWAIDAKLPASQSKVAFAVDGQSSRLARGGDGHAYANDDCTPNDYTVTTGSGIIVNGVTD